MGSNGIRVYKLNIAYEQLVFEDTQPYCLQLLKNNKPCPAYNNNWACPPFAPTYLQTKEQLSRYQYYLILIYEFDLVIWKELLQAKHPDWTKTKVETNALNSHLYNGVIYWGLRRLLKPYIGSQNTYVLGNSNCRLCQKCARKTNEKCRRPKQRIYSMEAAGINVDTTLRNIGYILEWPPSTKVVQVGLIAFKTLNPLSIP